MVSLPGQRLRTLNFAVLSGGLAIMNVLLGVLLYRITDFAQTAPPASPTRQSYLSRLGLLVGAVMILSLVMLALVVIHFVLTRLSERHDVRKSTSYEDAWTEAGRRLKPEDAPPVYPYEGPEKEDEPKE